MDTEIPRLVIAGLSGDSGKTVVSLALLSALRKKGLTVSAFKKGPDYIDAAWLSAVSQSPCRNLDTFLVSSQDVLNTFFKSAQRSDVALVEGNRGVFDGRDSVGSHSTAELAKLLGAPVILVVNATKTTRTVAALVKGCQAFDPEVTIAGVVLNRVAGKRHDGILRDTIERYCRIPVVGAIPRLGSDGDLIPGRHLGLVTPAESRGIDTLVDRMAELAERHLDIDRLLAIARQAPVSNLATTTRADARSVSTEPPVRIGYFRDRVFTFYYPENLEALTAAGAALVPVSSLDDAELPDIDALYIGGGFPETHTQQLGANRSLMKAVRRAGENGLPIYAECGGLIYLCRSLRVGNDVFPMAGLFPVDLDLSRKPVGHGYVEATVETDNPYFAVGTTIRGHEFHYTGPVDGAAEQVTCLRVTTGVGYRERRDGLIFRNVFAGYLHIHADGVKSWASALVSAARSHRRGRETTADDAETGHGRDKQDCVRAGNSTRPADRAYEERASRPDALARTG